MYIYIFIPKFDFKEHNNTFLDCYCIEKICFEKIIKKKNVVLK